jgi:hypothetical protein
MWSPVRLVGLAFTNALIPGLLLASLFGGLLGVLLPLSAEGANGVSAKIPFDPNPRHWFAKPQTQKQWEQEQTQKAKSAEADQQAKQEKARLKEEAQQAKAQNKKAQTRKGKKGASPHHEEAFASASPTASSAEATLGHAPNTVLPPDKTILDRECEPLRLKIVALNQQNRAAKLGTFVQRRKLMKAHETCLFEFSQKEIRYIKNFQFANKNNPSAEPVQGKTATPVPKGATLRIDNPSAQPQIEPKNTDLAPLKP